MESHAAQLAANFVAIRSGGSQAAAVLDFVTGDLLRGDTLSGCTRTKRSGCCAACGCTTPSAAFLAHFRRRVFRNIPAKKWIQGVSWLRRVSADSVIPLIRTGFPR
jgi:hypothetical protein